jgi:hypothetical protein
MHALSLRFLFIPLLWMGAWGCVQAANVDLGKYRLILDKELLGRDKPEVQPIKPTPRPPVSRASWADDYQMTMITQDNQTGKIRVGLQHLKNNTALLLIEGDNEFNKAYQIESANFDNASVRVRYQGVVHEFRLQEGANPTPEKPTIRRNSPTIRSSSNNSNQRVNVESAEPPPVPTPRFRSREELETHLKSVQMDAIRTGKPPLPIPLTPAMDDQLVKEGVLPPRN